MGQLGNGSWAPDSTGSTGDPSRAPTLVGGGVRFSQLSAKEYLTCGLTMPGRDVYCWGYGQSGETGDSAITGSCVGTLPYPNKPCTSALPVRVLPERLPGDYQEPNEIEFTSVAAGFRMACAVSTSAEAYCWGSNYRCELGRCRSAESWRAHRIAVPGRVAQIAAGYWHACARTEDLRIFCWGNNTDGQLGSLASANAGRDGRPPDYSDSTNAAARSAAYGDICFLGGRCSPAPVEVASSLRWVALAMGTEHACALAANDGGIYCWGGTDSAAFAGSAQLVLCENLSPQWRDSRCQPAPVRIRGLPTLAAPRVAAAVAASTRSGTIRSPNAARETRVLVNQHELRVEFPRDTAGLWGWSEREDPNYIAAYDWKVVIGSMDGPRLLFLHVAREKAQAREFTSLASLIAQGRPMLCVAGWGGGCDGDSVRASVVDERLVLTVRNAREMRRLFGMRPSTVSVFLNRPEESYDYAGDSVRVEYVAPQIPEPNAETRADAKRSRAAFERSIRSVSRSITGGPQRWADLWLALGDSATLNVSEMHCVYDVCSESGFAGDVTWTIDDSSVARLTRVPAERVEFSSAGRDRVIVRPVRVGRTTVRGALGASASDTAMSATPPGRKLSRVVHVTPMVARVELVPSSDTIRAGEQTEFHARALDAAGGVIAGAPVEAKVVSQSFVTSAGAEGRVWLTIDSPGTQTIVASFGGKADTVVVRVGPVRRR
jgi:hypothetical protein